MLHEIAPLVYHPEYRNLLPAPSDRVIVNVENELLIRNAELLNFPTVLEAGETAYRYLFSIETVRYFGVTEPEPAREVAEKLTASGGFLLVPERSVRHSAPQTEAFAAALGNQLLGWYRRNRFCGACGTPTVHDEKERMVRCPKCGNRIYPDIHPSVIIAIFHEDRLLVTRYNPKHRDVSNGKLFRAPAHETLVAGYIETGETAEEAVRRETMEEVGLRVKNIRFYKDTPWPFSGSLLFSFLCEVDGDPTIRLEKEELSMAEFRTRSEMPDRSGDVSLTSAIMEDFRLGRI